MLPFANTLAKYDLFGLLYCFVGSNVACAGRMSSILCVDEVIFRRIFLPPPWTPSFRHKPQVQ
jgi:hypothetical protein